MSHLFLVLLRTCVHFIIFIFIVVVVVVSSLFDVTIWLYIISEFSCSSPSPRRSLDVKSAKQSNRQSRSRAADQLHH